MNIFGSKLFTVNLKLITAASQSLKFSNKQNIIGQSFPYISSVINRFASNNPQQVVVENSVVAKKVTQEVVSKVNSLIETNEHGRLFAVVQVCGKQFKVTNNDLILVEGYWPPQPGDKIRLEKVLLLGSENFTLIGRPLLALDQVAVYATIIEKSLSHTRTRFLKKAKKQFMRIKFEKKEVTHLRISSIQVQPNVNKLSSVDGLKNKIF